MFTSYLLVLDCIEPNTVAVFKNRGRSNNLFLKSQQFSEKPVAVGLSLAADHVFVPGTKMLVKLIPVTSYRKRFS